MQAQKAEGTRDLIGAEMRAWQKMQQIAAGVFEPFGFKPIETPAIEQVDVFVHGIGQSTDVVRKEMFRVFSGANLERVFTEGTDTKLKPKQRLALRPEGTAGVVRAVVENNLVPQGSTPFRLLRRGHVPWRASPEGPPAPVPPGGHRVARRSRSGGRRRVHHHAHGVLQAPGLRSFQASSAH